LIYAQTGKKSGTNEVVGVQAHALYQGYFISCWKLQGLPRCHETVVTDGDNKTVKPTIVRSTMIAQQIVENKYRYVYLFFNGEWLVF
jgi:hypothetical protein